MVKFRTVITWLQIVQSDYKQRGNSWWIRNRYMSLVSAHAPMAKAPTGVKAKFVDDL